MPLGLLAMFYLSAIPMGLPEARTEGTYLIVNKNLIEAAAVLVLLTFRTGQHRADSISCGMRRVSVQKNAT